MLKKTVIMEILNELKHELEYEYKVTRKFFERFPDGENDYKPHEKSTGLLPLAIHITEIFSWPKVILETDNLDFGANGYQPLSLNTKEELVNALEENYHAGKTALESATTEALDGNWSISNADTVIAAWSKYGAIRHALNQITHHRAQLGIYYRLLDIPLPASYGPSADEQSI